MAPIRLEVYGLVNDVSFQRARLCAEDLSHKLIDTFPNPVIDGMVEFEWDLYIDAKKKELRGETWTFQEKAIIFQNGKLIGGPDDFIKWAAENYSYEQYRPEPLLNCLTEESYKSCLNEKHHEFVYMDITIGDEPAGRLVFELFKDVVPKTCENFKSLITGQKGKSEDSDYDLKYKGSLFHRIVRNGWIQGGDIYHGRGNGGESIYGPVFEDENYAVPHSRRGVIGMANKGRHTNGSQFYITLQPASWMDTKYVAFGQIIEGTETLEKMEKVDTMNERPNSEVKVADCERRLFVETNMFSSVKRPRRPLGHFVPSSRLELQMEKATFRMHSEILRNMCDKKLRNRQLQQMIENGDIPRPSPVSLINVSEHWNAPGISENNTQMPSDVRWLLTRSARMQRANNAGYSKFRNPVKNRVSSAGGRRDKRGVSLERQRSMCSRYDKVDISEEQKLQCDVLGADFCTDCTKINSKETVNRQQRKDFPRIEMHTRSLVAPERVEKLYLSHPNILFHQQKKYECGCPVDPRFEITTPIVYTPHEVFERIRRKKNIERGNELIRKETEVIRQHNNTPTKLSLQEEKTEAPLDLKVSVTFRNDGQYS
ncbi:putative inactive peptidyl-prolyl cis-trans isomerase-like 6 [Mactra antiquata]